MLVIMDRVPKDVFDDDEEVQLFMKDKIRNDVCLCKKYGKAIKRKPCPLCCDDQSQGEPRKKTKCHRTPTGNYGRTGCLAKPDLCTIQEHDVLSQVTDELMHIFGIKLTCKSKNKAIKKIQSGDLASANVHDVACADIDYQEDSNSNEHFETDNELTEYLQDTDITENNDTLLLNSADKGRIKSYGAIDERVNLKKSKENAVRDTLYSMTCSNSGSNVRGSYFLSGSQKPGDAKSVNRAPVQYSWQKQKPSLIPARDFINRYFISSPSNRNLSKNEMLKLRSTNDGISGDNTDGDENETNNQKIIDGLSRITIHYSNHDLTK